MNESPPVIAPGTPLDLSAPKASRVERLLAALIDGVIVAVITMVLMMIVRSQSVFLNGVLFAAIYVGINWKFVQEGQTIGKKVMNLRIVRKSGAPIAANDIVIRRMLPVLGANIVPYVGWIAVLVDNLLIFREGENTFHDDIADTKVIKLPAKAV